MRTLTPIAARSSALGKGTGKRAPDRLGEPLLRTFTEARDDLVTALNFILGNQEDARDMAQETFLRCWRGRGQLQEIQNLRAWIFRVGLNAAKDLRRSAWRRRGLPLTAPDLMPDRDRPVSEEVEERESRHQVQEALIGLRPEERQVFLLRQNGGLTYEQIAARIHRPVGTVKTQMRSALGKLRDVLA